MAASGCCRNARRGCSSPRRTEKNVTLSQSEWPDNNWTLGFDFESKRERIAIKYTHLPEEPEIIRVKSADCAAGRRKIAVKVVDIFGNGAMKIVEANIRG